MGDPKKHRKKYETPMHPWSRARIEEERPLMKDYGLKNKKELWKIQSKLRRYKRQARLLIAASTEQSKKEENQLLSKLFKLNLIEKDSKIDEVLAIPLTRALDRRLQTLVYKRAMAKTIDQARQFIIHGHVFIENKKVSVPSYLVARDEENKITFDPSSQLNKEDHPERIIVEKKQKKIGNGE